MLEDFNSIDKKALIATLIQVTHADGELDDSEVEYIKQFISMKGFEDFEELIDEVLEEITTQDTFVDLLKKVTSRQKQSIIAAIAHSAMVIDDAYHAAEIEILHTLCNTWGIDPASMKLAESVQSKSKTLSTQVLDTFTPIEQQALIATLIRIVHADGALEDKEVSYIRSILQHKGFDDPQSLIDEAASRIDTHTEYRALMKGITRSEAQFIILSLARSILTADDTFHEAELDLLYQICDWWSVDPESLQLPSC